MVSGENFPFEGTWRGRSYETKQVEAYAVREGEDCLVITVVVKYFWLHMTLRDRRTVKKASLCLLLLVLLFSGALRPQPARAVSTAVIVVSSIAGYVAFVLAGTWLVYTRTNASQQPLMPEAGLPETDRGAQGRLRLAPDCRSADATMPLFCW